MYINRVPGIDRKEDIIKTFRSIVKDLYYWITTYVINIFCNYGNEPFLSQRILLSLEEFINEMRKYYGNKVVDLKAIMQNQFFQLALLMNVLKIGDIKSAEKVREDVYINTSEIADYFASYNPNWTKDEWIRIIYDYIFYVQTVETCLKEIREPEKLDLISNETADYVSQGIIKQLKL
jgi:hypothetical protein